MSGIPLDSSDLLLKFEVRETEEKMKECFERQKILRDVFLKVHNL